MALGHMGKLHARIINQLKEGDIILTQRLDSFFSWGMMYFANSFVDHIAIYIGEGKILHMTLGGSKIHKLSVFGSKTRVLPVRLNIEKIHSQQAENINEKKQMHTDEARTRKRLSHFLPPKLQLVWGAIRIMLGLHQERFKWGLYLDILIVCIILDVLLYISVGKIFLLYIAAAWLTFVIINLVIYRIKRHLKIPHEPLSHPDLFWISIQEYGATLFVNERYGEKGKINFPSQNTVLQLLRERQ